MTDLLGIAPPSAAAWTAMASWFTAIVLAGSLLYARKQWAYSNEVRERQTRPYVVADLRDNPTGTSVYLVIYNYGNTAARNVRFEWDEDPVSTVWDEQGYPLAETNLLTQGIPTLPPGKEVVALFDSIPERLERGMLMSYGVRLHYEDQNEAKTYGPETFVLDLALYVGLLAESSKGLDDIARTLEAIRQQLAQWGGSEEAEQAGSEAALPAGPQAQLSDA